MYYRWIGLVIVIAATVANGFGQLPTLLDPTFSTGGGASDDVFAITRLNNGQYLIAGQFTAYGSTSRGRLARLDNNGDLDTSFFAGSGADNSIYAVAIQGDGKVLIGGEFTGVHGQAKSYFARLESNGALDTGFATGVTINNELRAIIVEPDGRVLIAGRFTQVAGQNRNRVARLNADGSLDATFNPGAGANDNVRSMLRQADGRILIGGLFTTYDGSARARIARLLSNGALDPSFDPGTGADGQVRVIATNSASQIYLGGEFKAYNGTNRPAVVRISSNGALDLSFDAGMSESAAVRTLAIQPDGKVWMGGAFRLEEPFFGLNIGRVNTDGSTDNFFDPAGAMNDEVFALDYDGGNRLLVGGKFTRVDDRPTRRLAMLNPQSDSTLFVIEDYLLDASEDTGPAQIPLRRRGALNIPASIGMTFRNGTAIAGEDFQPFTGNIEFAPNQTTGVAEVPILDDAYPEGTEWFEVEFAHANLPWGATNQIQQFYIFDNEYQTTIDDSFTPDFINSPVYALALQPDGKIVIGGTFRYTGGCLANSLARLESDGKTDCSFFLHSFGANGPVYSIAVQTNGAIIAAGGFTQFNSVTAHYIARVDSNGYADPDFNVGANLNGDIFATAVQPDGRILIGGMFTGYDSFPRTYLARLNSNGSLDPSFNPVLSDNGFVRAIRLTASGSILVAGDFTTVNGVPRSRLVRLTSSGAVDPGFNPTPGPNGRIMDFVELPDGRIVIGGDFTQVDNQPQERLARLLSTGQLDATFNAGGVTGGPQVNSVDVQADGKIVLGGSFNRVGPGYRPFIARVHANGALDTGFFPSSGANAEVHRVKVLPNQQILVAGSFTDIGGVSRLFLARLNPEPAINRIEAVWGSFNVNEFAGTAAVDIRRAGFSTTTVTVQYETVA
ncbi:MAG TPA: Calx-beta domain-containing protein, partial [Verrucomicrobiae bacterium]|nr:Calx-beta domain-containing protein [Verrucomicrobiae bacterium]